MRNSKKRKKSQQNLKKLGFSQEKVKDLIVTVKKS